MDWTSNLFIVLLLTDVTGTIFFLIGELFKRYVCDDVGLLHFLTKVTLCTFLVPFVYIFFYMDKRVCLIRIESNINLFYNTPLTLELGAALGCIWLGLFLALLVCRLYHAVLLGNDLQREYSGRGRGDFQSVYGDLCRVRNRR